MSPPNLTSTRNQWHTLGVAASFGCKAQSFQQLLADIARQCSPPTRSSCCGTKAALYIPGRAKQATAHPCRGCPSDHKTSALSHLPAPQVEPPNTPLSVIYIADHGLCFTSVALSEGAPPASPAGPAGAQTSFNSAGLITKLDFSCSPNAPLRVWLACPADAQPSSTSAAVSARLSGDVG